MTTETENSLARLSQRQGKRIKELEAVNAELLAALKKLVERCDGSEGVREDGSNIETIHAHALIENIEVQEDR